MVPEPEKVIAHIRKRGGRKGREVAEALGVAEEEREAFEKLLLDLQERGEIIRVPQKGWTVPRDTEYRVGAIRLSRRGGGFVSPGRPERAGDIRVRPDDVKDAFDGDLVMVRLGSGPPGRKGGRKAGKRPRKGRGKREGPPRFREGRLREGKVVQVLRRHQKLVRGRFWIAGKGPGPGFVRPLARHLPTEIYVASEDSAGARDGEKVLVRLLDGESHGVHPRGRVEVRVGEEGSLESDFQVIAAEFGFPIEHSPAALAEADSFKEVVDLIPGELAAGRVDLRGLPVFTIDPEDARDYDDAVSLEARPGGGWRLGVHIADVSRFAPSGSALDHSAELRGTSIYLPGRVVAMLPERLSNDLCSLRPDEDRLTKTVLMDFDARGEPAGARVFRSLIRNRRRFTYQEALAILDEADRRRGRGGERGEEAARAVYPRDRRGRQPGPAGGEGVPLPADAAEHLSTLGRMADLRDLLWARRRTRGALDLDLPRLRLRVDGSGETLSLDREERDPAHHLIEEFMLAANEAVAQYAGEVGLPLIARVHPPPDEERVDDFFQLLEQTGFEVGRKGGSQDLQRIVEATAGEPLAPVLHLSLLRSLAHAEYAPRPALHFALATAVYCHFTSPIRRYPDLLVHQALDDHLDGKLRARSRRQEWEAALPGHAASSSLAERRAEEAEREMTKLRLIRFLEPRKGEEMEAMVVSVLPFGFFVRALETCLEGLVHVSTLEDDYYEYDEEAFRLRGRGRGRSFRIGDRVRVELSELDADFREMGFRYLGRAGRG